MENMINDVAMALGRPADQVIIQSICLVLIISGTIINSCFQMVCQIREMNMYEGPSITHYKFAFSPENLRRCWQECKEKCEFSARRSAAQEFNLQHRWRKRGMAIVPVKFGVAFSESFLNQVSLVFFRHG